MNMDPLASYMNYRFLLSPIENSPFWQIENSNLWQRRITNMTSNSMNDCVNTDGIITGQQELTDHGQRMTQSPDTDRDVSSFQSHNKSSPGSTISSTPMSEEQNQRLIALLNKYGYHMVKENGQRKFCAPPEWNLPVPPRGCEVFIGKLPRDIYEDELVPLFEKCGRIYEMRLMMDFSGSNRGYAFVTYTDREEAKRACEELNNFEIRHGRHIGVVLSVDNCRLFVGGIPRNRTREDVKEEMMKLTDGVVDVILYPSAADKTKNRGFAFVEYESHRAAAKARRKLLPNRIQLWGSVIAVDWAEPEQEVDEATMATVKVLYVRNLMIHTTEDTLRKVFERAVGFNGCVERVKKMRDFAFVHFATREQALRARDELNGTDLDGAVIEVVLSKPPYQSNVVRCMKTLQKSGGHRATNIQLNNTHDEFMASAMRHAYAGGDPNVINGILANGSAIIPHSVIDQNKIQGANHPMLNVAAALTGYPFIDPYASLSQGLYERQGSYPGTVGIGQFKPVNGQHIQNGGDPFSGGRMVRGAAGMRSAGIQAMINNTMRQTGTSRRKFSEPLLCDYILNQHHSQQHHQPMLPAHQQALMSPPGVVLVPAGSGLPFWRPMIAPPSASFLPVIPTAPFTIPAPPTGPGPVSVVSETGTGPNTVTVSAADTSPGQEVQQPLTNNQPVIQAGAFFVNGANGPVPVTSYQQACYMGLE